MLSERLLEAFVHSSNFRLFFLIKKFCGEGRCAESLGLLGLSLVAVS